MADHCCGACGDPQVVLLATCHIAEFEDVVPGTPVGYVHCLDCKTDTPWHLSHRQNHLVCSNRADRKPPKEVL